MDRHLPWRGGKMEWQYKVFRTRPGNTYLSLSTFSVIVFDDHELNN